LKFKVIITLDYEVEAIDEQSAIETAIEDLYNVLPDGNSSANKGSVKVKVE